MNCRSFCETLENIEDQDCYDLEDMDFHLQICPRDCRKVIYEAYKSAFVQWRQYGTGIDYNLYYVFEQLLEKAE